MIYNLSAFLLLLHAHLAAASVGNMRTQKSVNLATNKRLFLSLYCIISYHVILCATNERKKQRKKTKRKGT